MTVGAALLAFLDGYYLRIDGRSFVGVRQDDWERESRRVRGQSEKALEPEKFDYTTLPAVLIDGLVCMQTHGQFRLLGPRSVTMEEHASWAADCLKALREHESDG